MKGARTRSPAASPELQRDRVQSDSTGSLLRGSLAPRSEGGEEVRRAAGSVSSPVLSSTVRNRLTLVQGITSMTTSKSDMSDKAEGETPLQKLYKQRRMYSLARQHLTVKGDGQTAPAIGAIGENGLPVDLPARGRVQALRWAMHAVRSSARRVIMEKKLVGTFQSLISERQAKQLLSEVRNMLADSMQEFVLDQDWNKLGDSVDAIKEEVSAIETEHGHHSLLVKFTDVVNRAFGRLKRQELAAQTYQNAREVLEAFKLDFTSDEDLVSADEAELVRQELLNAMAIIDDFERNATELRWMIEVLGSSDRDIEELDIDVHHTSQASGSSRASPAARSDHPAVSDTAAGDDGGGQQVSSGLHTPPVVPGSPSRDISVEKEDAGPQSSDAAGREEACVEADQGTVSERLAIQAKVGVDRMRQMRGDFTEVPKTDWEPIAQGFREELVAAGNGEEAAAQLVQALQQSAWKNQVHAAVDALVQRSSREESMLKACIENAEGELQEVVRRSQLFEAAQQIAKESKAGVEEDGEASAGSDESALLPPQEGGNADSPDPLALLADRLEVIVQAQALAPTLAACGGGGSQTPSERRGRQPSSNAGVRSASCSLVALGRGSTEPLREGPEAEKEEADSLAALRTPQHRHPAGTGLVGEQAAAGDSKAHNVDEDSAVEVAARRTRGSQGPATWLAGSSPTTSSRPEVSRKTIVNNFALGSLDEEMREKLEHTVSQVYADELAVGASQVTTVGRSLRNDTELEVKVKLSEGRSAFALKMQMQQCSGQLDSKVAETMASLAGASRDENVGGQGIVAGGALTVVTNPDSGWASPTLGQKSPLAAAQPAPLRAAAVASLSSARRPQSPADSRPWEDRKTTLTVEGPLSPQSSRSPEGRSRAHSSYDASSPQRRKSLLEDDRFGRWFPEQLERSRMPTWSRGADVLVARCKASREPSPREASKEGNTSQEKPLSLAGGSLSKASSTASPLVRSPRPSSKAKAKAKAVAKHDSTPGDLSSRAAQAVPPPLESPELKPLAGPGPPRQRPRASSLANPWWNATGSPSAPSASCSRLGGPAAVPGARTRAALWNFRKRVVLQWGDVEAAAGALSRCGGKVGGSTRISMATLHSQLQQSGFAPGCSELCVLFQALGLPCTETATLSQRELMRLESFENKVAELTDAELVRFDSLLGDLELRRMLVKGIDVPGQLISQVYLAVTRVEGARRADADRSTADAALADALKRCAEALEGEGAAALGSAVVSKMGLPVLVAAMVSASVANEARRAAASVVSAALGHATGLDSHAEALLVAELWLPLLRFFEWDEPEASPPVHRREQLDAATLEALLFVLQVARVPGMVAGQSGTTVAPQVASLLQRMAVRRLELHAFAQVLKANDVLVEGHVTLDSPSGGGSADEVHTMCAAFGGCGLLREQLASLAIKDKLSSIKAFGGSKEAEGEGEIGPSPKAARIKGEMLLRTWEAARQRLLTRWQGLSSATSHPRQASLWKLEALSKVDSRAHAEGFELSWEEQPSQSQSQVPQSLEEPPTVEPSSSLMQSWLPGTVEYEIVLRLLARDRIQAGTTCSPPRKLPPDPSARALGPVARTRKKLRPLGAQSARGAAKSGAQLPWSVSGPPGSARLSRNLDGPGATPLSAAVRRGELNARRGLYRPLPGLGQSPSGS